MWTVCVDCLQYAKPAKWKTEGLGRKLLLLASALVARLLILQGRLLSVSRVCSGNCS